MTIYKCPVRGKQYTDLDKLAECVKADNVAMKRVEAQKAADEARRKVEAAKAKTALREGYIKAINDSRKTVEKTYETLKTQIKAYNQIIEEAKQKADIVASTATSSLSFVKTQTSAAPKIYDWLDKTATTVKDADDLASVILKTLGI